MQVGAEAVVSCLLCEGSTAFRPVANLPSPNPDVTPEHEPSCLTAGTVCCCCNSREATSASAGIHYVRAQSALGSDPGLPPPEAPRAHLCRGELRDGTNVGCCAVAAPLERSKLHVRCSAGGLCSMAAAAGWEQPCVGAVAAACCRHGHGNRAPPLGEQWWQQQWWSFIRDGQRCGNCWYRGVLDVSGRCSHNSSWALAG